MLIKRRTFLQSGSLATASLMIPRFLKAFEGDSIYVPKGNKVLVMIQLSGGNDGLNTVIPIRNDIYYKSRPQIAIAANDALRLNDDTGLHPSLTGFRSLYDEGHLSIINNVGYPNPDRSHFRSMDIWQTASSSNEYISSGWIGRYLDAQCKDCNRQLKALEVDDVLSVAMKGNEVNGLAAKDINRLYLSTKQQMRGIIAKPDQNDSSNHSLDYLYKTMSETVSAADNLYKNSRAVQLRSSFPNSDIGKGLKTIASLILSEINTSVYYISLGSFDTHANQPAQQKRLFEQLNDAMKPFISEMKEQNRFEDILVVTFSEFGRRVGQNASAGTDHGTANNMLVAGGALKKPGLYNPLPDLSNLIDGDLNFTTDFRAVYATLLEKWLQADATAVLGDRYKPLSFV